MNMNEQGYVLEVNSEKFEIFKKRRVCGVFSGQSYVFKSVLRDILHTLQCNFEDLFERNITSNGKFWVSSVHDAPCTITAGMSMEAHGFSRAEKAQCVT